MGHHLLDCGGDELDLVWQESRASDIGHAIGRRELLERIHYVLVFGIRQDIRKF